MNFLVWVIEFALGYFLIMFIFNCYKATKYLKRLTNYCNGWHGGEESLFYEENKDRLTNSYRKYKFESIKYGLLTIICFIGFLLYFIK